MLYIFVWTSKYLNKYFVKKHNTYIILNKIIMILFHN